MALHRVALRNDRRSGHSSCGPVRDRREIEKDNPLKIIIKGKPNEVDAVVIGEACRVERLLRSNQIAATVEVVIYHRGVTVPVHPNEHDTFAIWRMAHDERLEHRREQIAARKMVKAQQENRKRVLRTLIEVGIFVLVITVALIIGIKARFSDPPPIVAQTLIGPTPTAVSVEEEIRPQTAEMERASILDPNTTLFWGTDTGWSFVNVPYLPSPDFYIAKIGCGGWRNEVCTNLQASPPPRMDPRRRFVYWYLFGNVYGIASPEINPSVYGQEQARRFYSEYMANWQNDYRGNTLFVDLEEAEKAWQVVDLRRADDPNAWPIWNRNRQLVDSFLNELRYLLKGSKQIGVYTGAPLYNIVGPDYTFPFDVVFWYAAYPTENTDSVCSTHDGTEENAINPLIEDPRAALDEYFARANPFDRFTVGNVQAVIWQYCNNQGSVSIQDPLLGFWPRVIDPQPVEEPAIRPVPETTRSKQIWVDQTRQIMYVKIGYNAAPVEIAVSTGAPGNRTNAWIGSVGPRYWSTFELDDLPKYNLSPSQSLDDLVALGDGWLADYGWYLYPGYGHSVLIQSIPYQFYNEQKYPYYSKMQALGQRATSSGNILVSPEDAEWLENWGIAGTAIVIFPFKMPIVWDELPCFDIADPTCIPKIFAIITGKVKP